MQGRATITPEGPEGQIDPDVFDKNGLGYGWEAMIRSLRAYPHDD